ncbi:MAG TPA: hypothetical protein VGX25_02305 [Actinophytocola sp.]|uniref:hypothetical protein n=1 Tax=Actinophytocola sp. TaxID=1872138 RepID=UPI002DDD9599|nr:hypothetical protein [Actinophytocola sp.]HEV2778210.1 hypothetical protein [Actinophytocola sp.]
MSAPAMYESPTTSTTSVVPGPACGSAAADGTNPSAAPAATTPTVMADSSRGGR